MNPRLPKDFLYLSMSVANRETGNSRLFIAEFQGSVFSWNVRRTPNVGHSSEALGLCKQRKRARQSGQALMARRLHSIDSNPAQFQL